MSSMSRFQVKILEEGSRVTKDYRIERVRIFVKDGVVSLPPSVG